MKTQVSVGESITRSALLETITRSALDPGEGAEPLPSLGWRSYTSRRFMAGYVSFLTLLGEFSDGSWNWGTVGGIDSDPTLQGDYSGSVLDNLKDWVIRSMTVFKSRGDQVGTSFGSGDVYTSFMDFQGGGYTPQVSASDSQTSADLSASKIFDRTVCEWYASGSGFDTSLDGRGVLELDPLLNGAISDTQITTGSNPRAPFLEFSQSQLGTAIDIDAAWISPDAGDFLGQTRDLIWTNDTWAITYDDYGYGFNNPWFDGSTFQPGNVGTGGLDPGDHTGNIIVTSVPPGTSTGVIGLSSYLLSVFPSLVGRIIAIGGWNLNTVGEIDFEIDQFKNTSSERIPIFTFRIRQYSNVVTGWLPAAGDVIAYIEFVSLQWMNPGDVLECPYIGSSPWPLATISGSSPAIPVTSDMYCMFAGDPPAGFNGAILLP